MQSEIRGSIGILGFGVDGQGVALWLIEQPGVEQIMVFDDTVPRPSPLVERPATSRQATIEVGKTLDGINLLFRSPGFPLTHPLMQEAKKKGIPITSSTRKVLGNFQGITVGITGSNGKTTCTALIEEFLKAEFGEGSVERGGNDGVPRLDLLGGADMPAAAGCPRKGQNNSPARAVPPEHAHAPMLVLELSSFQLIDSEYSPNFAVVLNITPNHLDWHKDMREYTEAKRQIVAHQCGMPLRGVPHATESRATDLAILNQKDPIVKTFAEGIKSKVHWFTDAIPWDQIRVKSHPDTIRAAVTAARALKVSEENILKVLREFKGVPHRLEFVRELYGIKYYNDSSCTTPESAMVACNSFPEEKLILLLGGRDKKMDFGRMYEVIKERRARVVPYGEMSETFAKNISSSLLIENPDRMDFGKTIERARAASKSGDVVVLSPACASFDMFKNAKERGKEFVEIVRGM